MAMSDSSGLYYFLELEYEGFVELTLNILYRDVAKSNNTKTTLKHLNVYLWFIILQAYISVNNHNQVNRLTTIWPNLGRLNAKFTVMHSGSDLWITGSVRDAFSKWLFSEINVQNVPNILQCRDLLFTVSFTLVQISEGPFSFAIM